MKIFTPTQSKSEAEQRASTDALRAKNLADITRELITEKNEAEASFDQTMKKQQEVSDIWFKDNLSRKQELETEVAKLEKRRKEALSPLLIKEEDIQSVQELLTARELSITAKETENEEESRLLMRKMDEFSHREQDLSKKEKRIQAWEQGVETQRNQSVLELKAMNTRMEEFQKRVEEKESEFAYRQSEIDALTNLQAEKEKGFVDREKEIASSMRLLTDQRLLLSKGFEELRNKQT